MRLALAGHHPRGARAALQPLRGRLAVRSHSGRCAPGSGVSRARLPPVNIVGAGLAGALLALLLARRGIAATLHERRPDPRQAAPERGRSINLALAARGMRALERAGVMERVRPLLIPMRGRMVHEPTGQTALQPYGQREHEVIWSVGRADLNRVLIEEAARHAGVEVRFSQLCLGADAPRDRLRLRDEASGAEREIALTPTIATDGAGSALRVSLATAGFLSVREDWLDHDYRELTVPPVAGAHTLEPYALHIWPRGGFMLIALPNTDGSFTATLFLARRGEKSFAALRTPEAVAGFFSREFPDAVPLMPDLLSQFAGHPQGQLGTVHATPWQIEGRVLLLGDAAHAIVPFHGQGMNAAFEDCTVPDRFIPRYSMVMFHPEIPYAEALRRGAVQAQLLDELDRGPGVEPDARLAEKLVRERLPPIG
ncbi:MAG: hypothetical protein E6K41_07265 [Gammaproteobacteria bacterium]|nr:MAG: hypothetical protein E6K41_07265 [Gammaproteobacteria bacterium]